MGAWNRGPLARIQGTMSNVKSALGAVRPWMVFAFAAVVVALGSYFLIEGLDPFLLIALAPLAVVAVLVGIAASRNGEWPAKSARLFVGALLVGLALYGLAYWLYDLAHPPTAAVPNLTRP